jgi:hypothetical protein
MFIDKFKILASIAEAVKKVVDEEDVEESGLRKAAYAAHSAGQSHFKFKGKTYPVKITKEHVDEMKESAEHDLQEGDAPSDYPTTARAANAASKTAKSKKEHAKASDLHNRAAYYALSDGRDSSVVRDHQMTAHEHSRAAKGLKEATGVTDYNPPSQGGTRKELTAKYHKTKDPKDAEAARKAGATQNELKGKLPEEEIKESDPLRARYSLPVTTVPYGYKRDWSPEGARKRQLRPDKNVPELKNAIKNTLGQHGPKGKLPEESNLDDESPIAEVKQPTGGLKKACWKGYTAVGMKSKGGRMVPNCVPEEVEEVEEAAKWRQGYSASGHPSGYKHKSGEIGPLGGTFTNQPSGYDGDTKKVPVQKYRDKKDELSGRADTKLGSRGQPLLPKNAQSNLKHAVKQSLGKHGPAGKLPEEVEEDTSIDEKAVNPYAVGMAAAKKSAGVTKTHDLPKSVITKGHEIAKKIIKKG